MIVEALIYAFIFVVSVVLTAQAVFTLGLMLYTWARPERLEESDSPKEYLPPKFSFTAIMPARGEEGVIGHTVRQVWESEYPKDLLEVVVVCEESDRGTIEEAEEAVAEIGHPGARVVTFAAGDGPVNKPRGLNAVLGETKNEVVTIFDAEDDVHPNLFNVINTTMLQKDASIVQAGVQLMDFRSSWYSLQNVLEYFFYFKSRLHYHAKVGMIPLGGNTVFVKRSLVEAVGGWDEACLTEDADLGIRLSVFGERIFVTYDAAHATREETPESLWGFVKQRTRWCQGFFQVFRKGDWKRLPDRRQRLLAAYTMTYPYFQAFVGALWIPAVVMILYLEVPVWLAILSLFPLYAICFQFLIGLLGLLDFTKAYGIRFKVRDFLRFTLGFLPYQLLLSISALRAVFRELGGATDWEKTAHSGAHRSSTEKKTTQQGDSSPKPASEPHSVTREATPEPLAETAHRPERSFPVAGFERMFEEAGELFGAERGSVMVLDPEEDAFSIRAGRGLPEEAARSAKPGANEGVAGWALRENAAAVISGGEAPGELQARLSRPELASSAVMPVERGGVRAVVSLSSESARLDREALDWLNDRVAGLLDGSPSEENRRPDWKEVTSYDR